ncbi:hypothetical protein DASC09_052680 [Saccharomycopsis crataegensis]|uniref:Uncharacterized protein n=1 Tax=Saccharomycopsis crataegensis TaxID=43959 RepID=A0AAV5QSX9_9ASCO|nr:hypothetical protein DASC09_052680 [Saccharomycopsis crataegensis]
MRNTIIISTLLFLSTKVNSVPLPNTLGITNSNSTVNETTATSSSILSKASVTTTQHRTLLSNNLLRGARIGVTENALNKLNNTTVDTSNNLSSNSSFHLSGMETDLGNSGNETLSGEVTRIQQDENNASSSDDDSDKEEEEGEEEEGEEEEDGNISLIELINEDPELLSMVLEEAAVSLTILSQYGITPSMIEQYLFSNTTTNSTEIINLLSSPDLANESTLLGNSSMLSGNSTLTFEEEASLLYDNLLEESTLASSYIEDYSATATAASMITATSNYQSVLEDLAVDYSTAETGGSDDLTQASVHTPVSDTSSLATATATATKIWIKPVIKDA